MGSGAAVTGDRSVAAGPVSGGPLAAALLILAAGPGPAPWLLAACCLALGCRADSARPAELCPSSSSRPCRPAVTAVSAMPCPSGIRCAGAVHPRMPRPGATAAMCCWPWAIPEGAIADQDRAMALDPANPDPHLNRGTAEEALGRWQAAAADYSWILERDPADASALYNLGNVRGLPGRLDRGAAAAIDAADRPVPVSPWPAPVPPWPPSSWGIPRRPNASSAS